MSPLLQGMVLVMLGGALVRLGATDLHLRYVKGGMAPLLVASGIVLAVVGFVAVVRASRGSDDGAHVGEQLHHPHRVRHEQEDGHGDGHDDGHDDGHGHGHGVPRVAWLMLLPVAAVYAVAPPALGADAARRDASSVSEPQVPFQPLPDGDPLPLGVVDFAERAVWDSTASLEGRRVQLHGFAVPDETGGGWVLGKVALSCCAADGQTYRVRVEGAPAPAEDQWVRITGTWQPTGEPPSEGQVPVLVAEDVVEVEEPVNPYE